MFDAIRDCRQVANDALAKATTSNFGIVPNATKFAYEAALARKNASGEDRLELIGFISSDMFTIYIHGNGFPEFKETPWTKG